MKHDAKLDIVRILHLSQLKITTLSVIHMMRFSDVLQVKSVTSENRGTETTNRKTHWMITDEKSVEGRMITDEIFLLYGH